MTPTISLAEDHQISDPTDLKLDQQMHLGGDKTTTWEPSNRHGHYQIIGNTKTRADTLHNKQQGKMDNTSQDGQKRIPKKKLYDAKPLTKL